MAWMLSIFQHHPFGRSSISTISSELQVIWQRTARLTRKTLQPSLKWIICLRSYTRTFWTPMNTFLHLLLRMASQLEHPQLYPTIPNMTFLNTQHTIYSISSRSMYVLTQSLACPLVTLVDTRSCGSQLEWLFKDPSKFKAYLGSSQCYMPFSKQELESRSIWPSGNHPDDLHQRPARWQR